MPIIGAFGGSGAGSGGTGSPAPALFGVTGNDWIEQTRRHLLTFHREQLTTLTTAVAAGTASLPLTSLTGVMPNQYVEIDLELFYVLSVDSTAGVAQVVGAQLGSRPGDHQAGALVRVNPRFPNMAIFTALNDVLRDMSGPQLFAIAARTLVYDPAVRGYDFGDSTVTNVLDIRFQTSGQVNVWPDISNYEIARNQDTGKFPSGIALFLYQPAWTQGYPVRIVYARPFSLLGAATDDVSVTGLGLTSLDLPPLGAAIRLMAGRSIRRNFTEGQPDPRLVAEVPPGAIEQSVRPLQVLWQQRWNSEVSSLKQLYPAHRARYGRRSAGMGMTAWGGWR